MLALSVLFSLAACGGNSDNTSTVSGSPPPPAPAPSPATGASCTGASRAATAYDVFLPTANGVVQSSANRDVQLYGAATDAGQCISVAASSAQADTSPGTVQIATTDDWNNAITYVDPIGTSVTGGVRFNQGLFVTCKSGGDTFLHVGISNPAGSSSSFVGSNQVATVVKDAALQSYECIQSGSTSSPGINTGSAITFSSADGSATVSDSVNGNTVIAASDLPSLFTPAGYNLNGKILHWYLYQLPVGSGTKQVIVHTAQRTDGTYNIDLFMTP